jgi:hypothetical protein
MEEEKSGSRSSAISLLGPASTRYSRNLPGFDVASRSLTAATELHLQQRLLLRGQAIDSAAGERQQTVEFFAGE